MAQSTQIRPRHERGHSDEMGLSAHRGRSTWRPSAPGVAWPAGVEHRPSAVAEPVGGDCADMAADHNLPRWRRRATAVAPLPSHKANPASERSKPASKRTPPGNEASEGWNPTAGQGLWFPPVLSQAVSRVGVPIALRQVILAVARRVGWICVSVVPHQSRARGSRDLPRRAIGRGSRLRYSVSGGRGPDRYCSRPSQVILPRGSCLGTGLRPLA